MDRTERFHLIDQMLSNKGQVSREQFLQALEISAATFKRDLEYLRDRLGAPIIWDRDRRAYCYQKSATGNSPYQLPGLWFNTGEIQALLTMNAWLENLQPGILSEHIRPLQARIRGLLDQGDHSVDEITRRIRILTQARKAYRQDFFQLISQALLMRNRLLIKHFNRQTASLTEREISPQRLTFYRDNWYLDSWCHQRKAIRSFSIDALQQLQIVPVKAIDLSDKKLDKELASGYGIFSGAKTRMAELRFTPQRARWVAQEQWHPEQKTRFDEHGFYYLRFPYSQQPELLMDILKYGADVEVLRPLSLKNSLIAIIDEMHQLYL
ncbi:MAG: WYL domain-containing protein [Gammaproteobacteria bacterium]|nr:WYL domain-containing protein [Gammaproteobacteria bacterium]MBL7000318.1 WYL domain-containing protein [Gammaproteobacteria bacterium]